MYEKKKKSVIAIKYAADERGNSHGGAGFKDFLSPKGLEKWKPSEGINKINVIPYNVTATHPLVVTNQTDVGDVCYSLDVYIHRGVGASQSNVTCLRQFGKRCPLCEEANRLYGLGTDEAKKQASKISGKRRIVYLVQDLNNNKFGWWDTGYNTVEKNIQAIAGFEVDEDTGAKIDVYDVEEGRSIKFIGTKNSFNGHEYIEPGNFSFEPRHPLSEQALSISTDLSQYLNIMSEEDMEKVLAGETVTPTDNSSKEPQSAAVSENLVKEAVKEEVKTETPAPTGKVCPCGYEWGDADNHPECATCKVWDKCIE